jgi:folate-binding protein YgfZ
MPKTQIQSQQDIVRTGCGLLDRSERGKLALTGPEAKAFLHGQVTNDVEGLSPGEGCYAAFLSHKGKMQGDLRVLDIGAPTPELWLDTERETLQPLFTMIHRYKLGSDLELHKRTLQQGLLSLIGPDARAVAGAEDLPQAEHRNAHGEVDGIPVLFVATDVGVDLVVDAERTDALAEALRARGARDVGEDAAEALRVERGRPRFGRDMDDSTIPQEAGINQRAVSFTKGCYVGQETVARLHYRGKPNRHLRGLALSAPAQPGTELRLGDKVVGRLGTVAGERALAIVRREAEPGATLRVGEGDTTAEVVELPFAAV